MIAVPAAHSYLGEDLLDVRGRAYLFAGDVVDVPLVRLSGVVLFPGESLPLRITESHYVEYLSALARRDLQDLGERSFLAIVCDHAEESATSSGAEHLGTVAEICSLQCADSEVRLLARGRYRCALMGRHRDDGLLRAVVRIADEQFPVCKATRATNYTVSPFPKWVGFFILFLLTWGSYLLY